MQTAPKQHPVGCPRLECGTSERFTRHACIILHGPAARGALAADVRSSRCEGDQFHPVARHDREAHITGKARVVGERIGRDSNRGVGGIHGGVDRDECDAGIGPPKPRDATTGRWRRKEAGNMPRDGHEGGRVRGGEGHDHHRGATCTCLGRWHALASRVTMRSASINQSRPWSITGRSLHAGGLGGPTVTAEVHQFTP